MAMAEMANKLIRIDGNEFRLMECGTCGVWFAMPETKYDHCYREGGFWCCPNGHSRGWKEGADKEETAQLRRERDNLKQQIARAEDEARVAWATANEQRQQRQAAEGKLREHQKRAGAGVCPCCNRTFSQLARHMQTKHPDVPYVPAKKAATKVRDG